MATSATILALTAFTVLAVSPVRAQQADHCEGTLCDLYYGSRGNTPPAAPAAPASTTQGIPPGATPLTAPSGGGLLGWFGGSSNGGASSTPRPAPPPSEEAASTNSYMHLGTGGLLGDRNQRCTGTLCDTFYGSSPTESPASQQAATTAEPTTGREPIVPHRHIVHESETRPKCSSPAADPWHCMR